MGGGSGGGCIIFIPIRKRDDNDKKHNRGYEIENIECSQNKPSPKINNSSNSKNNSSSQNIIPPATPSCCHIF